MAWAWGKGGAGWRGGGTHRSVLALGTVPGRLMSRSLRLQAERGQDGHPRTGSQGRGLGGQGVLLLSLTLLYFSQTPSPGVPWLVQSRASSSSSHLSSRTRPHRSQLMKQAHRGLLCINRASVFPSCVTSSWTPQIMPGGPSNLALPACRGTCRMCTSLCPVGFLGHSRGRAWASLVLHFLQHHAHSRCSVNICRRKRREGR